MSIESEDTFTRPVYAGNAISTVKSKDSIKIFTVRSSTWDAAQEGSEECKVDLQEAKDVGTSKKNFPLFTLFSLSSLSPSGMREE